MIEFPERHEAENPRDTPAVVLVHGGNVANWMWAPQLPALRDRVVLTPHLPGFGARVNEPWPGLDHTADDLEHRIRALGVTAPVHVVGLSLGAIVALRHAARHPASVASLFVSGATTLAAGPFTTMLGRAQTRLWNSRMLWQAQARGFGIPLDARDDFVAHGLSMHRATAEAILKDVCAGGLPAALSKFAAPTLAVAGARDTRAIRRSLTPIAALLPHAHTRIAPAMHHAWNIEDTTLFNETLTAWLDGRVSTALCPAE